MYTSKATQNMLKQQQAQQHHPSPQRGAPVKATVNPTDFSFSTTANGAPQSTLTGVPVPRNPAGTTAPASFLPVRPQKLPGDTIAGAASSSPIPVGAALDDVMLPHAAAHLAANNHLATRATKADAFETVVRSSESPLLYGPVAATAKAAQQREQQLKATMAASSPTPTFASSTKGATKGASTPTPGGQPPRPPSQQQRPGSAAKSNTAVAATPVPAPTTIDDDTATHASGAYPDFAAELEAIGRTHRAELAAAQKGRHRAALAQAASLRQSLAGPSPSPTPSSVAGPRADETFSPEDFEAYDGPHAPLPRRTDEDPDEEGRTATGKPLHVLYTPDIRARLPPGTAAHTMLQPKPMVLSDYKMLAEACQRAGRARTEAHAYYKIGEILSANKDTRPQAITYFKRYLNLARRLNDLQGEAKALNCLGVVHHELGGPANLQLAIEFHQQHAAIADAAGVFIANTNLGLAYKKLGDAAAALQAFKSTLKYAVRAGDRVAESLALANLGQAGAAAGDFATARVCVERHLELSSALQDSTAGCEAHEQLGNLAAQRGDYAAATHSFTMALEAALAEGDQGKARALRCQIGVVQGLLKAETAMAARAKDMGSSSGAAF